MHRIISWYNQNRRKIITYVVAIIILIGLWYYITQISIRNNSQQETNTSSISRIDENALNSITMSSQESVLSGEKISTSQTEITVLNDFIEYCNNGKIKEAYNLISDECKEEMFPKIDNFNEIYYKPIFGNGKRNVTTENWIGNIYKVDLHENALATGKYSDKSIIQDYITIIKVGEGYKLNINNYLGREEKNSVNENGNIEIKITQIDSYMDYEYYTFEVINKSEKDIALLDIQNLTSTYLVDDVGLTYNAPMNEIIQDNIVVEAGQTKKVRIKYLNRYSSERELVSLKFTKIILDYKDYQEHPVIYDNYGEIKLNL